MEGFAESLFHVGKHYSSSSIINVINLVPCAKTVRSNVICIASKLRDKFKSKLPAIFHYRVGVTCDKIKLTGKKYYNFVLHYPRIEKTFIGFEWCIRSKVLFFNTASWSEVCRKNKNQYQSISDVVYRKDSCLLWKVFWGSLLTVQQRCQQFLMHQFHLLLSRSATAGLAVFHHSWIRAGNQRWIKKKLRSLVLCQTWH